MCTLVLVKKKSAYFNKNIFLTKRLYESFESNRVIILKTLK